MSKKRFILATLLSCTILGTSVHTAAAGERYASRPPVVISPDLAAPWVMQLTGQGVQPAVSSRRIVVRQQEQQRRITRRDSVRVEGPRAGSTRLEGARVGGARVGGAQVRQVAAIRPDKPVRTQLDPQFLPQTVAYDTRHKPGTIVIDTINRFLYLVQNDGKARRYGVGVGKPGFEWAGTHKVTRKAEWPGWTPPKEMIAREAAKGHHLPAFMEGGPENPLGSRALYLGSTLYRIHGTNAPWTIGSAVSSGCIRMRNEDVVDLYERVGVGTTVIVI